MADVADQQAAMPVTTTHDALTTSAHEEVPHGEDTALGLDATGWVAVAMLAVIVIMLWKKVPAMITGALDGQIAKIRSTLDEAATLRTEAEALKSRMEAKLAASEGEAKAMLDAAKAEADALVAKAQADADALIARRRAGADAKIAAAERAAVARVRDAVASAAAGAARDVIAGQSNAATQARLTDAAIAEVGARLN